MYWSACRSLMMFMVCVSSNRDLILCVVQMLANARSIFTMKRKKAKCSVAEFVGLLHRMEVIDKTNANRKK